MKLFMTKISIPVQLKVAIASSGDETIGSPLLLNEVFRSVYIPVLSPNDDINL